MTEHARSDSRFTINLPFTSPGCPKCGEAQLPGPCPDCGTDVPEPDQVDAAVAARRSALSGFARQVREIVKTFESPPAAAIPLGPDQFMACIEDLDLVVRTARVAQAGTELGSFDFDDSRVVGGSVRRTVAAYVQGLEELRDDVWYLAGLEIAGSGARLRDMVIDMGRWAAEVLELILRAVVADRPTDAHEAAKAMQAKLDEFAFGEEIERLRAETERSVELDDDARVARVLATSANYTDEAGMLDLAAVLGAYADHEHPLEELARNASRYLTPLLGAPVESDNGAEALLVLPAVMLATLDRPLVAHRTARAAYDLLARAWKRDPDYVRRLVNRAGDDAPRILSAASRIQQSFRLLAQGGDAATDAAAVTTALEAYREVAESAYRMLGHLVLDVDRIASGRAATVPVDDAPMVGALTHALAGGEHEAARDLGGACSRELRNAVAHSQYRWDANSELVEDFKTGQTWDVDELHRAVTKLIGAVVGADASWSSFVIAHDIDVSPAWAADGSAPEAIELVATLVFSPRGFNVRSTENGGATVVIEPPDTIDPGYLIPPLAAMALHAREASRYRIKSAADGATLLEVEAVAMWRAMDADLKVRDLAVLETVVSAMVLSGRDLSEAVDEIATLEAKVVAVTGLNALAEDDGRATLATLRRRLAYLGALVSRAPRKTPDLEKLKDKLGRADASAAQAGADPEALETLEDRLGGLRHWADKRGVRWPPGLGAGRNSSP